MLIICTAVYILFVLIDVAPIMKTRQWKVFVIYSIIMVSAYTLTVMTDQGVKVPSPANPIKQFILSILGMQQG